MTTAVAIEYVWCSGANTHHDLRSKVKTVYVPRDQIPSRDEDPKPMLSKASEWNFDGSSTGQASGKDTEILIRPVAIWHHPFMCAVPSFVVLAECYLPSGEPTPDNTRAVARHIFEAKDAKGLEPWFGLEQEYVLFQHGRPLGWPENVEPAPQGPYYCSTGAMTAFGRKYAQEHYETCLKMGIKISGLNAEVMPGQWEYQVGPCEGIESGDHALMARWAYLRLLENENVDVNFDSKPKSGDWNGSGMHTNFSTAPMRKDGGMKEIEAAVQRLSADPLREVAAYGGDNIHRMTGHHETSRLDAFNYGVGTRNTSVRIPNQVRISGKGYFEDRRPSSSADPYIVTARLFASACGIPAAELEKLVDSRAESWVEALKQSNKK